MITYKIQDDGICSHCGRTAQMVDLPDGDVCFSNSCLCCDEYNLEQLILAKAAKQRVGLPVSRDEVELDSLLD